MIPLFVTNALDDRELPLYASTQNKREWLHVRDHCRAIELVLDRGRVGETYNVGSGVEKSIEEIADAVLELTGKPELAEEDRPGPAGPRPPLSARLHEAARGARLERRDPVRGRPRRDRPLVRGEPRVVGAAEGARPRRRSVLLALTKWSGGNAVARVRRCVDELAARAVERTRRGHCIVVISTACHQRGMASRRNVDPSFMPQLTARRPATPLLFAITAAFAVCAVEFVFHLSGGLRTFLNDWVYDNLVFAAGAACSRAASRSGATGSRGSSWGWPSCRGRPATPSGR